MLRSAIWDMKREDILHKPPGFGHYYSSYNLEVLTNSIYLFPLPPPQTVHSGKNQAQKKTYNSRDSPMVTHLTTSPPVLCLNRAERTGSLVFRVLWSYVLGQCKICAYIRLKWDLALTIRLPPAGGQKVVSSHPLLVSRSSFDSNMLHDRNLYKHK